MEGKPEHDQGPILSRRELPCATPEAAFLWFMESKCTQFFGKTVRLTALVGLALGCFLLLSCDQQPDATPTLTTSTPAPGFPPGTVGLRADPNPVLQTGANGKTTISWQTGSDQTGEVYLVEEKGERLFARGPFGSSDAPWIAPGSTRFRLYRGTEHKEVLAELTVTMGGSAPVTSPVPASTP